MNLNETFDNQQMHHSKLILTNPFWFHETVDLGETKWNIIQSRNSVSITDPNLNSLNLQSRGHNYKDQVI